MNEINVIQNPISTPGGYSFNSYLFLPSLSNLTVLRRGGTIYPGFGSGCATVSIIMLTFTLLFLTDYWLEFQSLFFISSSLYASLRSIHIWSCLFPGLFSPGQLLPPFSVHNSSTCLPELPKQWADLLYLGVHPSLL